MTTQNERPAEWDRAVLSILLRDRSSGKNLIWATDTYARYGAAFDSGEYITADAATGKRRIRPRTQKSKREQQWRIRDKAEVFTPAWVCRAQNDLIDAAWFECEDAFGADVVAFADTSGKTWQDYVRARRMELACGEAPYLTARYDAVTGEEIPLHARGGILDRKLRVVSERTASASDWYAWARTAVSSVYGFDWQGDNVFLARQNLLLTFIEAYAHKFGAPLSPSRVAEIAKILSWNIWQMDGLRCVVPDSCRPKRSRQISLFDGEPIPECEGCRLGGVAAHKGIYAKIVDWETGKAYAVAQLTQAKEPLVFFDAAVGNPPYQEEDGGAQKSAKPIYPYFAALAERLRATYVSLITPTRWYAGGKGTDEFRARMLSDTHLCELHDFLHPEEVFRGTHNRGGICWFLRDATRTNERGVKIVTHEGADNVSMDVRPLRTDGLDIFIREGAALRILRKVAPAGTPALQAHVSPRKPFGIEGNFVRSAQFATGRTPFAGGVLCYGKAKAEGYVPRETVTAHAEWIDAWKVFLPYANNIGTELPDDNQNAFVGAPGSVCTETFLAVGADLRLTEEAANNLCAYLRTKFARYLHGLCKSSQHGTAKTYRFVPMQDFGTSSDIRWDMQDDLDGQLYRKYGLTQEEIDDIENAIKPMQ